MSTVEIIRWDDQYHQDFIDLSIEWLEKYVSVEPADLEILNYPHKSVLDDGGEIFFARLDGKIIGTVAMIKTDENTFELAKLAVTPAYQGQKISNRLLEHCISFAKEKGAERIILYTNHKLTAAIGLYRKFGFSDMSLENNKYIESDMKMQLLLKEIK